MGSNARWWRAQKRHGIILIGLLLGTVMAVRWYTGVIELRDRVQFRCAGGTQAEFVLEVAATAGERAKGLMYRKPGDLAPHQGMIFAYPGVDELRFWMRNTYVSLDMIFLDPAGTVVGILPNVPILNDEPRTVGKPSRYVVELLAGSAERAGIVTGTTCTALPGWPTGK